MGGSEAFIPEVDGKRETPPQVLGESRHPLRLRTRGPAHSQRVADHDFLDAVLAQDMFQGREISSLILAADGLQALSGDPERIGNRQPDGLGAYVESQNAAATEPGLSGGGLTGGDTLRL